MGELTIDEEIIDEEVIDNEPDTEETEPEGDVEDAEEGEEQDEDGEAADTGENAPAKKVKPDDNAPMFSRAKLTEIVTGRVARAERQFVRGLEDAAGVTLEAEEPRNAARLWGLLKSNPELSNAVDALIGDHLSTGKARAVEKSTTANTELARKEAILDLRETDSTFSKHHKEILDWAEDNGFEVRDPSSLRLAHLAWKGANSTRLLAKAQLEGQRAAQTKTVTKQAAQLSRGKGVKGGKPFDYARATPKEILAHEGMRLTVEE